VYDHTTTISIMNMTKKTTAKLQSTFHELQHCTTHQWFKCVEILDLVAAEIQVHYLWAAVQEL